MKKHVYFLIINTITTMKKEKQLWKRISIPLIFFMFGTMPMIAQTFKVNGKVTDTGGEPLAGVSVVLKGTTKGMATDINGSYNIDVPQSGQQVLVFTYIGFKTIETTISPNQSRYDVVMDDSSLDLEEIVVVGYGTQKKANLTGSVSSMRLNDVKDIPISNTASLLQGRMSGVTVSTFTAQPGKDDDVEIRIRGINTLGNKNPMVLIDGVEGILSNVSPNDIESVSVLKDAASAAIYGVRAANGVILVTTKSGSAGEKRLSYSGSYGVQQATILPKYIDSYRWATLYNEQNTVNGTTESNYTQDMLQKLQNGSDPNHFANTDWSKELFRSAPIQNHHLSMTGGGVNSNYMASIGFMQQDGIMLGSSTDRVNFRLNTDTKYIDMITVGLNASGSHQQTKEPLIGTNNLFDYFRWHTRPTVPVKYQNGEWGYFDGNSFMQAIKNPVHAANKQGSTKTNRFDGKAFIDIEPIKNLHFKSSFAYQYNSWTSLFFNPTYTSVDAEGNPKGLGDTKNTLNETYYYGTQWINENLITYKMLFSGHTIDLLLGESTQFNGYRSSSGYGEEFPSNSIHVLDAALKTSSSGRAEEATLRSIFGRFNYNYKDRYMAEFNMRRDESSRIPKKNRVGYFPSVSVGWNIAEEAFMENIEAINALKLRASWGKLGNQEIGYYPFAQYIDLDQSYVWGDNKVPGSAITELANPDIKWETTTTTDIGIDATFWKNRISLTADYYIKNTSDILLQLPISHMLGATYPPYVNAAEVQNKGWEVSLGYNDNCNGWTYGVNFNLSHVENEIIDLNGRESWISGWTANLEGYPIGSYYGYKTDGLYKTQQQVDATPNNVGNAAVGDVRFLDLSGPDGVPDGVIDENDRSIIGSPFPKLTYGLNLTAGYKGIDFSAFLQGVGGVDRVVMEYPALAGNATELMWNRYHETANPNGTYPRFGNEQYNSLQSSFWIDDASYLRLKNIELGYSFKNEWIKKAKLNRLRIYVSAQNLFTITKIENYDPEKFTGDSRNYAYPNAKTYSVGINITL